MQEPSTATSSGALARNEPSTPESGTTPGPSSTTFNLNHTPSESSFLPAYAAVSSTPAARAQAANNNTLFASQRSTADPPWSALVGLDRELHEFTRADPERASTSTSTDSLSTSTCTSHISTHETKIRLKVEDYEDEIRRALLACLHP
jgi:hypothetical protein